MNRKAWKHQSEEQPSTNRNKNLLAFHKCSGSGSCLWAHSRGVFLGVTLFRHLNKNCTAVLSKSPSDPGKKAIIFELKPVTLNQITRLQMLSWELKCRHLFLKNLSPCN